MIPERQIRASYTGTAIRVYQAYSDAIADAALKHGTLVSPPFSMNRMTWIKPSFLWMMYRAGWGHKDDGQRRMLTDPDKLVRGRRGPAADCRSVLETTLAAFRHVGVDAPVCGYIRRL